MTVLSTPRLTLCELTQDDADFVLALYNDADFLRYIGDRQLRTASDARDYIDNHIRRSYREHGFGLWRVQRHSDATPLGVCGLVQRDYLPDADLGFALLPSTRREGITHEAAVGVLDYAARVLRMRRVCAIVQPDNAASIGLLNKLGFVFDRLCRRSAVEIELAVYAYWTPLREKT